MRRIPHEASRPTERRPNGSICETSVAGLVASVPGSVINPVVDAAFALLRNVFGAGNGVSARSAIGVNEPPGGIAVEIALIFQI